MKSKLEFNIRTDTKDGTAVLGLMGDDLSAVMNALHDAVVEIGCWADMPANAILGVLISVIAQEEDLDRKAAKSLGGQEKGGDRENGPADLRPGKGAGNNTGEGAGEVDEKG